MTRTVRTTMQPDREIEVDDAEHLDLSRQGLLVEDDKTSAPNTGPAEKKAAPTATTKKEG